MRANAVLVLAKSHAAAKTCIRFPSARGKASGNPMPSIVVLPAHNLLLKFLGHVSLNAHYLGAVAQDDQFRKDAKLRGRHG